MSTETTDVSDDDMIPAGVEITISPAEAYRLATAKSSSPIKSIEMEVEDNRVTYKIEYKDGSKIEIDASSGATVKSEFKNESDDSSDDEQEIEDEAEVEDESEDEDSSDDSSNDEIEVEDEEEDEPEDEEELES